MLRMHSQTAKLSEWRVYETAEAVAEHAAEWLCALACACQREFAICLSGGSTPRRLMSCRSFAMLSALSMGMRSRTADALAQRLP